MLTSHSGTRLRIAPVDGLRAVAVLGVVWFHVWQAYGNLPWLMGVGHHHVNLNEPLSIGQTGVDLFFVISGFCMYLMYARKQAIFSWSAYGSFLRARFLRLAPAYYAAIAFFTIGFIVADGHVPLHNLIVNALWLPQFTHVAHDYPTPFWSLSVEWGFYLILPGLVWGTVRFGFVRSIVAIGSLAFLLRLACFVVFPASHNGVLDWSWATLPSTCLVEFVPGVIVAKCYTNGLAIPRFLSGYAGLAVALAVTVMGRILMWHSFSGHIGAAAGVVGLPLMTIGYGLLLWNAVESRTALQQLLSTAPLQAVGRWSYSIYLFHMAAIPAIAAAIMAADGRNVLSQYLAFALVLAAIIPASALTYTLFERPCFAASSRTNRPKTAPIATVAD